MPLVDAASRRFVVRLTVAIVGELMNEIADAAVLHLVEESSVASKA